MKLRLPTLPAVLTREIVLPEKWALYLWKGGNIGVGALLLFLTMYFFYFYVEEAEHAVVKGKRVIISIPTETVQARSPAKQKEEDVSQNVTPVINTVPQIIIVVNGLGMDREATKAALALPHNVTLSFSPYAMQDGWEKLLVGRTNILVDLPLEPTDYPQQEAGDLALFTQLDSAENKRRLEMIVARIPGIEGLLASSNEKYTASLTGMQPVLDVLKQRSMMLLYEAKESNRMLADDARAQGVKLVEINTIPFSVIERGMLASILAAIESTAKQKGYAVVVLPAYSGIFREVAAWAEQLEGRGLKLTTLKALFPPPQQTAATSLVEK